MAKAVITPRFGQALKNAREAKGWSLSDVAYQVHVKAGPALRKLSGPQLFRYEQGVVKHPDFLAVGYVAAVLELDFADLLAALRTDLEHEPKSHTRNKAIGESPPRPRRSARG